MTPPANAHETGWRRRGCLLIASVACAMATGWPLASVAQGPGTAAKPAAKSSAAEQGVRWAELKPAQQASLKPLEREWAGIDAQRKQKWLELAARFPKLTPAERTRIQDRMAEWAKLTPRERGEARMHFQEAKQVPAEDRQARWKAYEALSPEQKRQLAAKAAPAATDAARRPTAQAKSNIVPNPTLTAPPKTIAPTVVQARPGATTTLITKRPTPPGHQQTGMPKIAATPEFVNKSTLLPQRGPQGAATRSATAAASEPPRAQ